MSRPSDTYQADVRVADDLRDRVARLLARAERAEAERDKWADAAASWELQAVGNRADAERLAEALKVSEAERDALLERWARLKAWVYESLSRSANTPIVHDTLAAVWSELEAPDA